MVSTHRTLEQWQSLLGLSDWTIEYRGGCDLKGEEARIFKNVEQRYARIEVDMRCPPDLTSYTIVHELLHIVFTVPEWWMKDGRTPEQMHYADESLETTINRIAQALTGARWYPWHPDDEIKNTRTSGA